MLVLLLGMLGPAGWCESAWGGAGLSLADAVANALRHSDDARIGRLQADQAADGVGQERSSYLPHLEVTSGAGYSNRQNDKLRAVNAQGTEKVYQLNSLGAREGWLNVEIEQLLFDLGQWRRIEQRELVADAAETAVAERRDAVARDVVAAYVKVLRLEELQALARERVEQTRRLDDQAAALLREGHVLPTEREQAGVLAAEAALDVDTLAADLAQARAALRSAIGDPDTDVSQLDAASVPSPEPPAGDLASDRTLAATPALRVLDLRRRAEERGLAAARAGRYPTIGMRAGYSNYGPHRYDNYLDEMSVSVDFRVPLFDGNRTKYQVSDATKSVEIAELRYRTLLESKRARVNDLSAQLASSKARSELAARRSALVRDRVRLADLTLQTQRGTVAEALAARDAFARDAAAAIEARYDRIAIWADLLLESGQLAQTVLGGQPVPTPVAR